MIYVIQIPIFGINFEYFHFLYPTSTPPGLPKSYQKIEHCGNKRGYKQVKMKNVCTLVRRSDKTSKMHACMQPNFFFLKHGKFRQLAYMYFEFFRCSSKSLFKMSK